MGYSRESIPWSSGWSKCSGSSGVAYTVKAGDTTYFSLRTEWDNIIETYNLDKSGKNMFKYFNKPALDDAIRAGKEIRFSHNSEIYGECALKWEWTIYKRNMDIL